MLGMNEQVEESELVKRALAGSHEAFDRLIAALLPRLRQAALRLTHHDADADELIQETLTAAFRGIRTLQNPAAWRGWVYQILVRRNYDRLLRRHRPPVAGPPEESVDPLASLLRDETRRLALRTLETLDKPLRDVLKLRYLHDLALKDISLRMGRPLGTVKYLVHEALRSFEKAFRERIS
jgi:RNA polymerase sigma-70 factor (ECF subfamily)